MLLAPTMITKLYAPGEAYLRPKLERIFGRKIEDVLTAEKRADEWAALEKGFGLLASWFEAAGDGRLLFMGGGGTEGSNGTLCHADTSIAGLLVYARVGWGEESEEWRRIESLDGGRWKRFLAFFEKWVDTSR